MTVTLVVKSGITDKKHYEFQPGKTYFIGRSRQADIVVKDQQASRRHCAIEATPDGTWTLADQDSSNGTYVNRQRTKTRTLKSGDVIQVGKTTFEVQLAGAPAEPKPEPKAKKPEEETLLVGSDGQLQPKKPEPAPKPAERPATDSKPTVKGEGADEELQDLFAFLDKIEAGERPAAVDGQKPQPRSVPHEPPPPTPARAEPKPNADGKGALFDLVDKAEPAPKADEPKPEAEQPKGGGLLGFLRRKKKTQP